MHFGEPNFEGVLLLECCGNLSGGFLLCCMVDAYMYLHAHVAIKATIGMGSISVALLSAVLGRVRVYSPRHG